MSISLNTIKCPECGANLDVEEGRKKLFCSFCGAQIILSNDNEHIIHTIDDAEVKHAQTEQLIKVRQLEIAAKEQEAEERRKNIKFIISVIVGLFGVICIFFGYSTDESDYLMPGMVALTILMYMWLFNGISHNRNQNYEMISTDGKISLPAGVKMYQGKNYQALETLFTSAGFTNVQSLALGDLTTGFLSKPNVVESISINGKDINQIMADARLMPDSKVIITYHSFR